MSGHAMWRRSRKKPRDWRAVRNALLHDEALKEGGWTWGQISVVPRAEIERDNGTYRVIELNGLHIYVSPTGDRVRVFRDNEELLSRHAWAKKASAEERAATDTGEAGGEASEGRDAARVRDQREPDRGVPGALEGESGG